MKLKELLNEARNDGSVLDTEYAMGITVSNGVETYRFSKPVHTYEEWMIKCFKNGKRYEDGDIFDSDKESVVETLKADIAFMIKRNPAWHIVKDL